MTSKGILFKTQFNDKNWNRGFATDFLIQDKSIILEVNGAFKYNNGILQQYYLDRQKIIENSGYIVIQIYYSKVYDHQFLDNLVDKYLFSCE